MSEVTATLQFIITIEILGLIGFPISHKLFSKLPDRGWGFSKIVGLLLSAWVIWTLSSLRLVPFTPVNALATTLFVGLLSWLLLFRTKLRVIPAQAILFIVIEELLFLGIIAAWTFLRGLSPDYNGLEKFMDYGFMLSAMQTKYFPPLDHFLSGETINYYYYGHYIAAFMATLSRVPANLAYNLQMSLLFGLTAMQSFALASGLYHLISRLEVKRLPWRSISTGILGALLVSFFGNLHTAIFYPGNPTGYWYPDATRFIEFTIHEFPIYSFIVNDLHGHVSDIPMVLLVLGILLIFILKQRERLVFGNVRDLIKQIQIPTIGILAFVVGTMYATNAWDFAIYLVLSGLVFWTINASISGEKIFWKQLFHYQVLLTTALQSLLLLITAIVFYAPFWISLLPITKGIGIVPFGSHSPLWQIAVLWGAQVPLATAFVMWIFKTPDAPKTIGHRILSFVAKLWNIVIEIKTKKEHISLDEDESVATMQLGSKKLSPIYVYAILLTVLSVLLIILPEIIFIRDIYPTHFRANTMFKFYYQAWIMLGIVSALGVVQMWSYYNKNRTIMGVFYKGISALLIFAALLYPINAIEQGFGGFEDRTRNSIDGTAYLDVRYASDSAAIDWINENINGQPTFAEAVGESYTDASLVAANTGKPVVMGWPVHEWLWRGDYSASMKPTTEVEKRAGIIDSVGTRVEDMRILYETTDVEIVRSLVEKYGIEYIYVGSLEREKYKLANIFSEIYQPVYDQNDTVIYQTPQR